MKTLVLFHISEFAGMAAKSLLDGVEDTTGGTINGSIESKQSYGLLSAPIKKM